MVEKFVMTYKEKKDLVIQLVAEELAYEKYGGAQKAVNDAIKLLSWLTEEQITSIFVGASKTGLEMMTYGGNPKKYDTLGIIRDFKQRNRLHGELDEDCKKVAQSSTDHKEK